MIDLLKNNSQVKYFYSAYTGKDICIAIDSSKTNTALYVGDSGCNELDYYEIRGGGSDVDLWDLCKAQRCLVRELFKGASIKLIGIEDVITKHNHGMEEHISRLAITAVFVSLISVFQDDFGIMPKLINNMAWKSEVLPPPYNTREFDKGSLAYHQHIRSKLANCTDDVTDAHSILMYMKKIYKGEMVTRIKAPIACNISYKNIIVNCKATYPSNYIKFKFNEDLSYKQTMDYMVACVGDGQCGICEIPTAVIPTESLCLNLRGEFDLIEEKLLLVVRRNE